MNRHKTFLIEDIEKVDYCGKSILHFKGGEYEIPFETKPTNGKHNLKECKRCQNTHKIILEDAAKRFKKFPKCCKSHSNLIKLKIFNKDDFKSVPEFVADKVMYCHHHVINNLDSENWYQDYLQYMEYTEESFGMMPQNCGEPFMLDYFYSRFSELINGLNENDLETKLISKGEIKKRLEKLKKSIIPYPKANKSILKELLSIYDKWYSIFPFDFPYFKHLKDKYQKILPLNTGRTRHNKYLNITIPEAHTEESLTQVLLDITNNILASINGVTLYEKGFLNDIDKISLELIIHQRKLNLKKFKEKPKNDAKRYIKSLNYWFKGEKKFLSDIKPFLESKAKAKSNTQRPNRTDIAYYCYYTSQTGTLNIKSNFPSIEAWKEIENEFGKNWKNIQTAYNLIVNNKAERLKKSKVGNIEYVINNMLKGNEKAKELAKDELKLAKLNL